MGNSDPRDPARAPPVLAVVLQQILELVEVDTWGAPFEFAHFRDGEIARAATRVARRLHPGAPRIFAKAVSQVRPHRGDISDLWNRWYHRGVSKPAVAAELWPVLERRLRAAADTAAADTGDIAAVPLGRVLVRVSELASLPRHGWALQAR